MDLDNREYPLHEDVLDEIVSHVSPLALIPASCVSRSWRRAVSASLRRNPRRRIPWLIVHLHSRRNPNRPILTYAFDPNSKSWIQIPIHISVPNLTSSTLLHSLSPTDLAFSTDAFAATWRHLPPPRISREDAVVALVGTRLVVAGGVHAFEYGADPCNVETCALEGGQWEACEPLPDAFRDSASATWLSVAASDREMYVLEKHAGVLCSFDPDSKRWGRPRKLGLDPAVFLTAVGLSGDRLIVVGAAGEATCVERITMWEVDREGMEVKEMGRMPVEMVWRMVGDGWGLSSSIGLMVAGDFGYVYNPSDPGEVFMCEFVGEAAGGCRWASVGTPAAVKDNPMHSMVFRCAPVGMDDLKNISSPVIGMDT